MLGEFAKKLNEENIGITLRQSNRLTWLVS